MEKQLENYIGSIKTDRKKLLELKSLLVKHQQFGLASNVRDIEKDSFPISDKNEILKKEAITFQSAMAMVDIQVNEAGAFIAFNVAKELIEKNIEISLKDVSVIKALAEEIYG